MSKTSKIISQAYAESRKALLENEAKTICIEYNIPVTKFILAKTCKESVVAAQQIGFPVVLKIVSPQIIHKSDSGGVMLNLNNVKNIEKAFNKIMINVKKYKPQANIIGVLVQEMAPSSTEVIVGAIKDPQFGQTLMFGLGGIFVEILKDVTFRVAPIRIEDAFEIADLLFNDEEIYVLKGYGWMLKEASNTYQNEVFAYVMKNKKDMPRTSLRYAIEKMPEKMRKKAMEKN